MIIEFYSVAKPTTFWVWRFQNFSSMSLTSILNLVSSMQLSQPCIPCHVMLCLGAFSEFQDHLLTILSHT